MFRLMSGVGVLILFCCTANGQTGSSENAAASSPATVRIWVMPKEVKSVQGEFSSAALLKELGTRCVGVTLTDTEQRADYRLEAGHAWCCTPRGESRGYVFTLFNRDGDAIYSTKTHALANAVKDICNAIGHEKPK